MVRDSNETGNDRMFLEYYTMDDIDIQSALGIPYVQGYSIHALDDLS